MERYDLLRELENLFTIAGKHFRNRLTTLLAGEVTPAEYFFLVYLEENGGAKPSQAAQKFDVSFSHMTALSDKLIHKGLIVRSRSEADRRVVELELSDRGRDLLKRLQKAKMQYYEKMLDHLSVEEIQQLIRIYKKILPTEK